MGRCFILPLALGLAATGAEAAAPAGDPSPPNDTQIRSWIAELANTGPERRHKYPWDRLTDREPEALKPVQKAYTNLTRHFMVSLPLLVESIDDARFSFPQEHPSSGVFENMTVGDACLRIIERKILLQNPQVIDARGIAVCCHLPIDKEWYSRAKGKSLFELQLFALNWLLRQPPPDGVATEEWQQQLTHVQAYRDKFVREGKAVDLAFGPPIEGK